MSQAQSYLVSRMRDYNLDSTNVALVLPKTRSDDIRWLQKYIKTQYAEDTRLDFYTANIATQTDPTLHHLYTR